MKNLKLLIPLLLVSQISNAQIIQKHAKGKAPVAAPAHRAQVPAAKKKAPVDAGPALSAQSQRQLSETLAMVRSGQCAKAAPQLYTMSKKSEFEGERFQLKYLLGSCLLDLKMYQIAAFQFVDVIRKGETKYTKQAIEKLSMAADYLGDDTLLNYAISRVEVNDFPEANRDMIYFRLGEIKLKNGKYGEAADLFGKVGPGSRYIAQAKFSRGLAFMEGKYNQEALRIFKDILASKEGGSVTDVNRVAAQMGIARTYYQAGKWEEAIDAYRDIPRDTEAWHDALFESSWAMLRAAKFRSALSNFQSLHSTYYEDFYLPESMLLRAIVYLFICKYEEMDKILNLFEKTYSPLRENIVQFMNTNSDSAAYFNEIEKAYNLKRDKKITGAMKLPYSVARSILDEGDVKRSLIYLRNLAQEKLRVEQTPAVLKSSLGSYALKVLGNRGRNTKVAVGEMVKSHLMTVRNELKDLYEQAGFIRYEMINGKKEILKKKIAGKALEQVDEKVDRTFFVQNGYEYWPFEGEYWLDEIGNYHYLGKQSCE